MVMIEYKRLKGNVEVEGVRSKKVRFEDHSKSKKLMKKRKRYGNVKLLMTKEQVKSLKLRLYLPRKNIFKNKSNIRALLTKTASL